MRKCAALVAGLVLNLCPATLPTALAQDVCVEDTTGVQLCVSPGIREGAFVLEQNGRNPVLIASFPSDAAACPKQQFVLRFASFSEPPNMRPAGHVVVSAQATSCSAQIDTTIDLPKGDRYYGLDAKELERNRFNPRAETLPGIGPSLASQTEHSRIGDTVLLEQLRKAKKYDSLTLWRDNPGLYQTYGGRGSSQGVLTAGRPCAKAGSKARQKVCMAEHAKAVVSGIPFVSTSCRNCQVRTASSLRLVATKNHSVTVIDNFSRAFGPIDTAEKALFATDADAVAPSADGGWIVNRKTVGGTCAPYEFIQIYDTISRAGSITATNIVVAGRDFTKCA